jgi:hypothetical protein
MGNLVERSLWWTAVVGLAFFLLALFGCSKPGLRTRPLPSMSGGNGGVGGGGQPTMTCTPPGMMRVCCGNGVQTCSNDEFPTWGPCLSASGSVLTCCIPDELQTCDGGVPPDAAPPPPDMAQPLPILCYSDGAHREDITVAAVLPAEGTSVGPNDQLRVWATDEFPLIIAEGEKVDMNSGMIVTPGSNRTAPDYDGFLKEPALYIAPQLFPNGGKPYFPSMVRGNFSPEPAGYGGGPVNPGLNVPGVEPKPATLGYLPYPNQASYSSQGSDAEYFWDVAALGLPPGDYLGQFIIRDGDNDHGVACIHFTIRAK